MSFQRGFDVVSGRRNVTSDVTSDVTSNVPNVPSDVVSDVVSNVVSDVGSFVGSDVSSLSVVQLSERQKKICKLIKENPFISGEQMSVVLSVVPRTIWRDLAAMQKQGVLIREGNTSAGHWVLLIENE